MKATSISLASLALILGAGYYYSSINEQPVEGEELHVVNNHALQDEVLVEEGYEGEWSEWSMATRDGFFACGMQIRMQGFQGITEDDTGLNGLKIKYCNVQNWWQQEEIFVAEGDFGDWGDFQMCSEQQFIDSAQIKQEQDMGEFDDSGITGLNFRCVDIMRQEGNDSEISIHQLEEGAWGTWRDWTDDHVNFQACGAKVRYGTNDQDRTSISGIKLKVCEPVVKIHQIKVTWLQIANGTDISSSLRVGPMNPNAQNQILQSDYQQEYFDGIYLNSTNPIYRFEAGNIGYALQDSIYPAARTQIQELLNSAFDQYELLEEEVSCPGTVDMVMYQYAIQIIPELPFVHDEITVKTNKYKCPTAEQGAPKCPDVYCSRGKKCQTCRSPY